MDNLFNFNLNFFNDFFSCSDFNDLVNVFLNNFVDFNELRDDSFKFNNLMLFDNSFNDFLDFNDLWYFND